MLISYFSGRIHPAKISCLNTLNRTVTVEWLENGETKAKEVNGAIQNKYLKRAV